MPVQWCRIELGEDEDFVDATIDTITHRNIDQPVSSPNRHLYKK
jgi:hypothetical protein